MAEEALVSAWQPTIKQDGTSLSRAIHYGLGRLGYDRIKSEQQQAVEAILLGRDAFVSLPTGFGKSLSFQLLPFCAEFLLQSSSCSTIAREELPLVLVVAPLTALMQDQVMKLNNRGIKAVFLSTDCPSTVIDSECRFLFASPEALLGVQRWRSMLISKQFWARLVAIAIDEAHCVVKW